MSKIADHPLRYALANELHARPFPTIEVPGFAAYLAIKFSPDADVRDHLLARRSMGYVSAHLIALAYLGLGERDEMLTWFERGIDERDPMSVWLKEHFVYDELRSDPRFQELVDQMNFPDD